MDLPQGMCNDSKNKAYAHDMHSCSGFDETGHPANVGFFWTARCAFRARIPAHGCSGFDCHRVSYVVANGYRRLLYGECMSRDSRVYYHH